MVKALKFGIAVGLVVGAYETIKLKSATQTWPGAIQAGLMNGTTIAAAVAAAVAAFVL